MEIENDDGVCLIFLLPLELWHYVIKFLRPWEALQLRQTCKRAIEIVTLFQSYWYRQFCWYLIGHKKRAAMYKTGCSRRHRSDIKRGLNCLSLEQEQQLITKHNLALSELPIFLLLNPDIVECSNANHYIYDLPQTRFDIPLDRNDYKPGQQVYLYRFLIHNYRQQRQRIKRYNKAEVEDELKLLRGDISRKRKDLTKIIAQRKREIDKAKRHDTHLRDIQRQLKRFEHNRIFHGCKSRGYRGLLTSIVDAKNKI